MLTPSTNNPLPWSKREVRIAFGGLAAIWAVIDARGDEVCRLDDITKGAEQTADFIVSAANIASQVVPEVESAQICAGSKGPQ